ncbi:hypothetical protein L3X38_044110 [Prunus dulcis]|uniref:Uncharacterized protein n=1 Tax=Prunus dulcis TaxID=3755 RepID=A0AAD4YN51_PRUDU|nr:hypothetical protein L3X38_044110 [Prunus dulcis]
MFCVSHIISMFVEHYVKVAFHRVFLLLDQTSLFQELQKEEEVEALKEIRKKLMKKDWDFGERYRRRALDYID